jgi:putative transposase
VRIYRLIDAETTHHAVSRLCRALGVSRAGYYAWARPEPGQRAGEDAELTEQITAAHQRSRGTYGAPRIHADLREAGVRIGRKRVARLMRAAGLVGCHRRRRRGVTRRDAAARPAPDLVNRQFTATAPNRRWTADIKQVPTGEGWLYVAPVIDLFSRACVGWAMADHMRAELVIEAVEVAVARRDPASGVVHHSDQGSQYTSIGFTDRCAELGIVRSMGSVGDCFDNAVSESFNATLACELLAGRDFATRAEARAAIFEWITCWYNPSRRHSTLDYLAPHEYEHRHALTASAQ